MSESKAQTPTSWDVKLGKLVGLKHAVAGQKGLHQWQALRQALRQALAAIVAFLLCHCDALTDSCWLCCQLAPKPTLMPFGEID